MSVRNQSPLLAFLADLQTAAGLDDESWSLLFAEARACSLMQRVGSVVAGMPAQLGIPDRFRHHIVTARRQAEGMTLAVRRELDFVAAATASLPRPVLLLKGAAYVASNLPPAEGRIFSDIDLLVERSFVPATEAALMLAGWRMGRLNDYDRRYYREWSHEVPPMSHIQRGTTIDLHHSLVMPTCRIKVDSRRMIADAIPIAGTAWHRLRDEDMVLHAAAHLLLNSEFERSLRDLWDIQLLLHHFTATDAEFPNRLMARASEVGLSSVLGQTDALLRLIFGLRVQDEAPRVSPALMALLIRAASTRHPDTRPRFQRTADQLLFIRELWLRLPLHLLVRHLLHKAGPILEADNSRQRAG